MDQLIKKASLLTYIAFAPCYCFANGELMTSKSESEITASTLTNPASVKLVEAAKERTKHQVTYDGAYISIPYPNGDVPDNIGVCTDVVIRSYRKLGIDLQKLVHEDMRVRFSEYPKIWGLKRPDRNIDHRRVPNLQTYFKKQGASLPVTRDPYDYLPGDMVTWMLPGNLPHIGIVSDERSLDGERYLILHNIGFGPKQDDFLFGAEITGHYRFYPEAR